MYNNIITYDSVKLCKTESVGVKVIFPQRFIPPRPVFDLLWSQAFNLFSFSLSQSVCLIKDQRGDDFSCAWIKVFYLFLQKEITFPFIP